MIRCHLVLIPACLLLASVLPGCAPENPELSIDGRTMGTTYSVKVPNSTKAGDAESLKQRIDAELDRVNAIMSTYQAESELSRFNANASIDWVPVSLELAQLVEQAQNVSRDSGGAFDVTVGPLVNLWGFGPEVSADRVPGATRIDAAKARVGYEKLEVRLQPPALRKRRSDLYVDLSAIAKGHGADRVARVLEEQGLPNYLAEVGGEVRVRGRNRFGQPWRLAVERPDVASRAVFRVLALTDAGMATSGDYRNFFELGGKRYSHSIDPVTGRPVDHQLASVSVVMETAELADAWATALLVLGPQEGMRLAQARDMAVLFIEREGDDYRVTETEAMKRIAEGG